jgi:putative ABC transport system permease protein
MLDDDSFRQYCAENGVDAGHYFDPEHPAALIYNQGIVGHGQPRTFYSYHLVRANRLPVTCCMEETREIKGYTVVDQQTDENGATWYLYYPQEYMEQVWSSEEEEALDERKALRLSEEEALVRIHLTIDAIVDAPPFSMGADTPLIIYPCSMRSAVLEDSIADSLFNGTTLSFATNHHAQVYQRMEQSLLSSGLGISAQLSDQAADRESARALVMAVNVFAYGFIVLISLIAVANVFNTISTSISLRQREFAMLRSMGMQESGMRRMLNYECVIYGLKALLWGLPASLLMTYVIYRITGIAYNRGFFVPWHSVIIAVISVFLVVFVTMIYAMHKLKEKTVIDGLKNETL